MSLRQSILSLVSEHPEGLTKRQITRMLGQDSIAVSQQVQNMALQGRLAVLNKREQTHSKAYSYVLGKHGNDVWEHGKWVEYGQKTGNHQKSDK